MRTAVSSVLAVAATLAAAVFANGCSAEAGCKPGNEKIDGECRLLCTKQAECPSDYSCTTGAGKSFCTKNEAGVSTAKGEFGTACNATLKAIEGHPDCAAGFQCFGTSPTDADAYCTKYLCVGDSDCPGGFYCATVNSAPNVATYLRSWRGKTEGAITTVCKKRSDFCSPCESDVDCATRGYGGAPLRCVAGAGGTKFCTNECSSDASCDRDSACKDAAGVKVCQPNAGACKGDGSLCSRCSSDAECKDGGFCLEQEYTKEKFCTAAPTGGACATGACGAPPAGAPWAIGCAKATNGLTPTDQCLGLRPFDSEGNDYLGCWAKSAGGQ
jgi:hypothetical protein